MSRPGTLSAKPLTRNDHQTFDETWKFTLFILKHFSDLAKQKVRVNISFLWPKTYRLGKGEGGFISSVRSSSGYHGLIEIRQQRKATFSNFSNSSDSKVKVKAKGPNTCYIFEKHGIQGYQIWHSRVSNVKNTNTRLIHKYANTQIQSA